ncbi:hypothetical protein Tco_1215228 [Tanacetum coccineum]
MQAGSTSSSEKGMVRTIEGGPWFIRSVPIFLNIWEVNTKLKREIMSKVLIKLSSECAAMETIVVVILLPNGKGHYLEALEVEYEWWPPRCSKYKIFGYEDYACPSRGNKANLDSLEGRSGSCDDGAKLKKKGKNKAPNESPKVIMNDSYGPVNEHGYYKDDIDLGQLRSNIDKLMDENKVLDINPNINSVDSGETMCLNPNAKGVLTTLGSVLAKVNRSVKGSLLEQFCKTHEASTSKHKSVIEDSDKSEVEEVYGPDMLPGGGFLDDLEDDLDCYDGYEDQVYDLPKKVQAFCAQYDIDCSNLYYIYNIK